MEKDSERAMVRWQDVLLRECWRVIDAGGGEIKILFKPRIGSKLRPEIYPYPNNQIVCEEVEVEEGD